MCQARAAVVPVICRASVSLCFKTRLMPYTGLLMQVKTCTGVGIDVFMAVQMHHA